MDSISWTESSCMCVWFAVRSSKCRRDAGDSRAIHGNGWARRGRERRWISVCPSTSNGNDLDGIPDDVRPAAAGRYDFRKAWETTERRGAFGDECYARGNWLRWFSLRVSQARQVPNLGASPQRRANSNWRV